MTFGIEEQSSKFIITEALTTEQQGVWNTIRGAFTERNCIAYWQYPIFSQVGEVRKEPDILIIDRELGLVAIQILPVTISQIVAINDEIWQLQNFETAEVKPHQLVEHQLRALIAYSDREPAIWRKVSARGIVALPHITQEQWQERGFQQLANSQNILFQNQLDLETGNFTSLQNYISQTSPIIPGENLEDKDWQLLLSVMSGTAVLRKPQHNVTSNGKSRSNIINGLRDKLYDIDLQQEHIGKEIPPGMQRIRGIAGSGKTVLLCQKAAHMHLKHPEWDIALVFFSRSLYDQMINLVDKWLRRFSGGELQYNPQTNTKLRVLHAWGAKEQPGLYGIICDRLGQRRQTVTDVEEKQPHQALAQLCKRLQEEVKIEPMFDAILIDEGQDLVCDENFKFGDKQPIYWLAYQALRPVSEEQPQEKRLIWAYDEAQSLDNLIVPTAREVFGDELSDILNKQPQYPGGIKRSHIMRKCYRTPGQILIAAHAIGMGLLRQGGMLSGITNKKHWESIGYEVEGDFRKLGQEITIHRPAKYSPNPIAEIWGEPLLDFTTYSSRQEELTALSEKILHNIVHDGLNPSRDILVLILGTVAEARDLETQVAEFLIQQGIDIYIPSAPKNNTINFPWQASQPNRFWHDGSVTISRLPRAKGNEADMVYVVGLDYIAHNESNVTLRNQLFVAMTRTKGWLNLTGVGNYPIYEEINKVITACDTLKFVYNRPPKRDISEDT
jgi:superfamily I DNA and RNA helicase